MSFKSWILKSGLSKASAKKYASAVLGPITNWAKEAGLIDFSLFEVSNPDDLIKLTEKITQLPIFQERNKKGNNMYSSALNKYYEYLKDASNELKEDLENIITNESYPETDKTTLIKSRIGQGKFRDNLIAYWKCCAVTGYKTHSLLIASHIKPWRDSDNQERLDQFNGLLLTPNLDKAFDTGFISFDSTGKILISDVLESPTILGIEQTMKINFKVPHQKYLEYHRDVVFLSL